MAEGSLHLGPGRPARSQSRRASPSSPLAHSSGVLGWPLGARLCWTLGRCTNQPGSADYQLLVLRPTLKGFQGAKQGEAGEYSRWQREAWYILGAAWIPRHHCRGCGQEVVWGLHALASVSLGVQLRGDDGVCLLGLAWEECVRRQRASVRDFRPGLSLVWISLWRRSLSGSGQPRAWAGQVSDSV